MKFLKKKFFSEKFLSQKINKVMSYEKKNHAYFIGIAILKRSFLAIIIILGCQQLDFDNYYKIILKV